MPDLIRSIEEKGHRAKADRRFLQGIVVSRDDVHGTCVIDVGAFDASGNPVMLRDIPFTRNAIPQVNDLVPLTYGNSSPHSLRIGGGQVGGGNTGQVVNSNAVRTVRANASPQLQGDVRFLDGSNVTITQTGQDITISAASGGSSKTRDLHVTSANLALSADASKIYMVVIDSGPSRTVTLPDPSTHIGVELYVTAASNPASGHTLARYAGEKIDKAAANLTLGNGVGSGRVKHIQLISDGTDWWSINQVLA